MKKYAILAVALLLTLGLSQCKKDQPAAQIAESGNFHITLKVGNNGSKADVNPTTGQITFEEEEKLYVGYNGEKVGELTYSYSSGIFSGDLTILPAGNDKPLYFYFMGGVTATQVGETQQYTVNISDQTGYANKRVISCGVSTEPYAADRFEYTTTLINKCGLVKFTTNVCSQTVSVAAQNTEVTVDFATGTITTGTPGTISFNTDDFGSARAIFLTQDAVDNAAVTTCGFDDGTCSIPAIANNLICNVNVSLSPSLTNTHPFTVNANGGKVYFSKGNLEGYNGAYRFRDNQSDVIGGSMYLGFNYINLVPGWRVLSKDEWEYLFRDENENWGFATVNGTKGIIILPDDFTDLGHYFNFHHNHNDFGSYDPLNPTYDNYNGDVWTALENQGAVFLCIKEETMYTEARYWSSTTFNNSNAYVLYVGQQNTSPYTVIKPEFRTHPSTDEHVAWIRLVKDVDSSKSSQ